MDAIVGSGLLGFGFNILGSYDTSSATQSILQPVSGDSGTYTDPYSGNTYTIPNNVTVIRGDGDQTQDAAVHVASDSQQFASFFATQAGVSGSYRGFSGEFNFAFSNTAATERTYWYCVALGSFQTWTVLLQQASVGNLSAAFQNDPDVEALYKLPEPVVFGPDNQATFFQVFQKWGTHFIDQVTLGGNFSYFVAVSTSFSSDQTTIQSNLSLEYKSLFVDAAAQASVDWQTLGQTWSSDRQVHWAASGGNTDLLSSVVPNPGYGDSFSPAFASWAASIAGAPSVIGFHLSDLSNLFSGSLQEAVSAALAAYSNQGVYVEASYTSSGGGDSGITGSTGLIMLSGTTVENPEPVPPTGLGGAQLVVLNGTTLDPVVNVGTVLTASDPPAPLWEPMAQAIQGLTEASYVVVLAVYGAFGTYFPTPDVAQWLAGCGASLSAWKQGLSVYCGDDYQVSYVMVGQQGLEPGHAAEIFNWDYVADHQAPAVGTFSAILSVPLVPPVGEGPYSLAVPGVDALLNRAQLKRAALAAPGAIQPPQCFWPGPGPWSNTWWPLGSRTCFDGTERVCGVAGWVTYGPC